MTDDSPTGSVPQVGRPKRTPPTLELAATTVSERPAGDGPRAAPTAAQPGAHDTASPDAAAPDTAPSDMPPAEMPASEIPVSDMGGSDMAGSGVAGSGLTGSDRPAAGTSASAADAAAPDAPESPPRAEKPSLLAPIVAGLLAGAAAGAIAAGATWYALAGTTPADRSETDALTARVAQLEGRPLPKPDSRIDGLETSIAALRAEIAATKTRTERTAAEIGQLKAAPPAATATVDLAPVTARLAALEGATGELKSAAARQSAAPADDAPLRRSVAAALLDTAVRRNEPYAEALAALRGVAGDAAPLASLAPFAAGGVPGDAALSRELLALLPGLAPPPAPAAPNGLVDRLKTSAARLVHIERIDAAGNPTDSAAGRAAAAARNNDVAAAKRELLTLAPAERAPVQPWLDKVAARDAALAASRQFAADAMAALSKPAP